MFGPAETSRRRIFARPEDVHCVIFHLLVLACYACAFWIWFHPLQFGIDGPWSRAAFVVSAAFLCGWISGVDVGVNFHNHAHRRIFRAPALNRCFGRIWTFSGGWPSFFWEHAHVTVHHACLLESEDWTVARRRADGRFENLYRYILLHWPWRYAVHLFRDFRGGRAGPAGGRKALYELTIFLGLYSIPFWIDPWMALCLWVLPHWVANVVTMGSGMYVQHAGCEVKSPEQPLRHSNSFLSPFFNRTMFNIGYHSVHHDFPGVHWADLPSFHDEHAERLAEGGAHIVPYGYYGAARILSSVFDRGGAEERFASDAVELKPVSPAPIPLQAERGSELASRRSSEPA